MRTANTEIVAMIKSKTLELLLRKNPDQIGMRDIATNCGITAANIYHYYEDKEALFRAICLDCLNELNDLITQGASEGSTAKERLVNALEAYCGWCFDNPRRALLVMQGIKTAAGAPMEEIQRYYVCNRTGTELLEACVAQGIARSEDARLDVDVLIFGLWGCIEAVLLKKSDVKYWDDGRKFTDRFIKMWMHDIFGGME